MNLYLTISTSNDIKLIFLSLIISVVLLYVFVAVKFIAFIKKHQSDNEQYRSKTTQQLNEKDTNSS